MIIRTLLIPFGSVGYIRLILLAIWYLYAVVHSIPWHHDSNDVYQSSSIMA